MTRRVCAFESCDNSLEGKRPHALYCSRSCKSKACNRRLRDSGVLRDRDRLRYEREGEHRRAYARQYLKDNAEKMRAVRRNRKSRIKAQRFLITDREWNRMKARYRNCCAYCGQKSEELHREHVIPIARGGRDSIGNSLPSCPSCNYRKKTKLLSEWRFSEQRRGGEAHVPTRNGARSSLARS